MRHSLPPFASRFHSPNKRLYHPRLLAKQEGRGYVDFREVTHGPSCRFISRLLPAAAQFSYQPLIPEIQFPRITLLKGSWIETTYPLLKDVWPVSKTFLFDTAGRTPAQSHLESHP